MDKYSTPEERLLHLIRRKNEKQKAGGEESVSRPKIISAYGRWAKQGAIFSAVFSFKNLKKILISIAIVLVLYISVELLFLRGSDTKLAKTTMRSQGEDKGGAIQPSALKPYSYYSAQFDQRDIFETTPYAGSIAKSSTVSANLSQLTKDLKLVGVILDNNPQAIIESNTDKKTYFLRKGELINDMKLEVITESKVILSYGNEKIELAL
ncbi:MAG: hypothetical protein Q8N14_02285 [Candidatus Omnitrophota bacterium]|nr:hypothetical protein [Candidatus Omnitrophota bacterium]